MCEALIQSIAHWWSIPMQSDYILRKSHVFVLPDSHQATEIFTSFEHVVQSPLPSIDAQTILFSARVDPQVAENRIHLFHVHVIYEPHHPHRVLCAFTLELLIPLGRQCFGDVRTKVWCDAWLVLVKPFLNTNGTRNKNRLKYCWNALNSSFVFWWASFETLRYNFFLTSQTPSFIYRASTVCLA